MVVIGILESEIQKNEPLVFLRNHVKSEEFPQVFQELEDADEVLAALEP